MPEFRHGQETTGLFEVLVRAVPIALRERVVRSSELGLDVAEQLFAADPDVMRRGAGGDEDAGEKCRVTLTHGAMS
jgi:hypothetical protein